jgi:hypothetical protein
MEGGVECGVREVSDLEVALQDSRGAVEGQGEFEVDSETFHVGGSGERRFKWGLREVRRHGGATGTVGLGWVGYVWFMADCFEDATLENKILFIIRWIKFEWKTYDESRALPSFHRT